jgi:hypothetical protein
MLSILFAGLAPLIWHLSGAALIIAAALAWAWFMPIFRKEALMIAAAVALTTTAYAVGVTDGGHRVKAQWDATIAKDRADAEQAATDADAICGTPECVRNDKYNRDR